MRRTVAGVVGVGGVLLAVTALAQPLQMPPGRWWSRPQVVEQVGLSPEQKTSLDRVTVEHAKRMVDLKATVEKAEIDVRVAAESEPFDARLLRQAFAQLQQARARLETERFELLVAQRELLTTQQWLKLRALAREVLEQRRDAREPEGAPRAPRRPEGPGRF